MAPSIVIGTDDYQELRRKERAILTSAMANIRVRRLASETYSWADDIAGLLESSRPAGSGAHASAANNGAVGDAAALTARA
jgi:hypothetical protein